MLSLGRGEVHMVEQVEDEVIRVCERITKLRRLKDGVDHQPLFPDSIIDTVDKVYKNNFLYLEYLMKKLSDFFPDELKEFSKKLEKGSINPKDLEEKC